MSRYGEQIKGAAAVAGAVGPAVDKLGGPAGVLGRAIGMGAAEVRAGVPGWAWFGVGVMAGAVLGYTGHDKVSRLFGK